SYSVIQLPKEQAGSAFFEKYEQKQSLPSSPCSGKNSPSSTTSDDNYASQSSTTTGAERKKKTMKEHGSINGRVKKAIDNESDLYAMLGCSNSSSSEDIRRNYRALVLIFHPDKKNGKTAGKQSLPTGYKMPSNFESMTEEQLNEQ